MSGPRDVRAAVAGDAVAIARIHTQGISERVATFETRAPSAADVERLISSGKLVMVAERDGVLVGFARVSPYSDPSDHYAGVGELTLYVDRDARRRGVGRALLDALAREAERRGYWKLVGKVFASNLPSLELLRSAGWREVGLHRRHGRLAGEWKDVMVVELALGETGG